MTTHEKDKPPLEQTIIKLPSVRVGLGTLFTFGCFCATLCSGAFWMYTENRYKDVFVTKEVYAKDQGFRQEQYSKDQMYIQTTVTEIKAGQIEMQKDIKKLIEKPAR